MPTLPLYLIFIVFFFVLAFKEYLQKIEELNKLSAEIIKLQSDQNALIHALSQQSVQINEAVNNSSTTNTSFYVFLGICVVVVLALGYIYVSYTPVETVSEVIAKNMPEISKVSTNSTLDAIEKTTISLADKLHLIDINLEKLSDNTIEIGIKCASIESKTAELITKLTGENVPIELVSQISQNGIFG